MSNSAATESLTLDVVELLKFFDEKHGASKGDATGIVAVIGEDLNAACFQHYVESQKGRAVVLSDTVGTGGRRGPRLDRWIEVQWVDEQKFLYQTEIKNWSAAAIGGENLPVNATAQDVADYKQRRWDRHWDMERKTLKGNGTAKVLVPMKKPDRYNGFDAKPLLIFWEALGPKEKADDHLFSAPVTYPYERPESWPDSTQFERLWVFSVSSYLRHLKEKCPKIHLPMPNAARRKQTLNRLFS